MKSRLKSLSVSIMISGGILYLIGAYYAVIKAGIPYQDPTQELQIEYAINMGIGSLLLKWGFLLLISGGILRILLSVKKSGKQRDNKK